MFYTFLQCLPEGCCVIRLKRDIKSIFMYSLWAESKMLCYVNADACFMSLNICSVWHILLSILAVTKRTTMPWFSRGPTGQQSIISKFSHFHDSLDIIITNSDDDQNDHKSRKLIIYNNQHECNYKTTATAL